MPPDTPEGQEAKAALDGFLDNVQQSDDQVRAAIAGLPENAGLAQIVAELSGLATGIQQTVESGRTLITDIQELGRRSRTGSRTPTPARSWASPDYPLIRRGGETGNTRPT